MRRAAPWLAGGLGILLVVGGVVLFAVANTADVGWTAYTASYAPLEPSSDWTIGFADGSVLWTWRHAVAAGLAVLGLLVLVGLGGWFLGRRSTSGGTSPR
jgi:hypothetical protein